MPLDLVVEPEPKPKGYSSSDGNLLMRMEMTFMMVMMILMVISTSMRVMRMIGTIGVGMILMVISISIKVIGMIEVKVLVPLMEMAFRVILMLKYLDAGDLVRNQLLRNHNGMGLSPLIVMRVLVILKWKRLEK